MANTALLTVKILADAEQAQAGFDNAAKSAGRFSAGMANLVAPAAAVATGLAAMGAASIKAASDSQQAMGGLDAVFGKNAAQVKAWADNAATSVGLSKTQYAEMAAQIGAQLKNLGVPMDEVAGKTDEMVRMGADLAATYGGTTADAVEALGAALRGEADPAERYGLALNQAAIKAKMAEDGTDKLTGAAAKQAKTAALMALATEQAGGAMGQFAREADSAAGAGQIATAQWEDAKAALGDALLPAATAAATVLGKLATILKENSGVALVIAAAIGIVTVAILAYAAAQWVANAALLAFPGTWIAIAIIAVVAAVVILWMKCEKFRTAMLAIWSGIKTAIWAVGVAARAVAAFFTAAWAKVTGLVKSLVAVVRQVAAVIKTAFSVAWRFVGNLVKAYGTTVRAVFSAVASVARTVSNIVKTVFRAAWNMVRAIASSVAASVRAAMTRISAAASAVANRIKAVFRAAWSAVKAAASAAFSGVVAAIRKIVSPAVAAAARLKQALTAAFNAIKSAAGSVGAAIRRAFAGVQNTIDRIRGAISSVKSAIASLRSTKIPKVPKAGRVAPTATAVGLRTAAPVGLARPRATASTTGGAGPTIIVQGALDPERVARQIRDILNDASARRHGVVLAARTA